MNIQRPSTLTSTSTSTRSPAVNIVRAGTQVPQDALVEMISLSVFYFDKLDWNERYPQLALSRRPSLRQGVHEQGEFTKLREWQLHGHCARVGTGMPRRRSWPQEGPDLLGLSVQRQENGSAVCAAHKGAPGCAEHAIARGPGSANSFSLVCEKCKLRVYVRKNVEDRDSLSGAC